MNTDMGLNSLQNIFNCSTIVENLLFLMWESDISVLCVYVTFLTGAKSLYSFSASFTSSQVLGSTKYCCKDGNTRISTLLRYEATSP